VTATEPNGDESNVPFEPPVDPAALLLEELLGVGQWLRLGEDVVRPGLHFFQYTWYDAETDDVETDIIAIRNRADVFAKRVNSREDLVWKFGPASLHEVLAALRLLPHPGTPGAPTEPLRSGAPADMPSKTVGC
jgi:hypothetical protein